jgi:hypothetical protein
LNKNNSPPGQPSGFTLQNLDASEKVEIRSCGTFYIVVSFFFRGGRPKDESMKRNDDQIVATAVEARGGRLGRPILIVLIVSVALAVAFMAFSYMGTPRP